MANAKGLLKAAEYRYQDNEIKGIIENITVDYTTNQNIDKLEYSGEKPQKGKVQITSNGKISMAVKIKDKCYLKTFGSEDIQVIDYNVDTCKLTKSFANDSWTDIKSNLMFDRNSYEIGETKEVVIDDTSYTVRLSNTQSCPNDWPITASQTTCGVVIEFEDIIEERQINSTRTNIGGWEASEIRQYLNTTLFNKLPYELKNGIILPTKVVSGHGLTPGESNFTSVDKIYLLSYVEIWGQNSIYDSLELQIDGVTDGTRQLEYYVNNTSNISKMNKPTNGTPYTWWLRSAYSATNSHFNFAITTIMTNGFADESEGVAPAFRILD